MKILKGIFIIISIICILFSCFFVYSSASGNTELLHKIERGLLVIGVNSGITTIHGSNGSSGSESTVSMLTEKFGLTTSQAGQVISIASQLGVNTDDPAEMSRFIAKNAGNADEIKDVARRYQSGEISESQAKALLAGIVNV